MVTLSAVLLQAEAEWHGVPGRLAAVVKNKM